MANIKIFEPINAGQGHITAGKTDIKEIKDAAKEIKTCLANIGPLTPSCCIDGRYNIGTLANADQIPANPKPAVAGGSILTAYAAAEMAGDWFDPEESTSQKQRLDLIDNLLAQKGIIHGAHSDEKAIENNFKNEKNLPKTGCGVNDNFILVFDSLYKNEQIVNNYTRMLVGKKFEDKFMKFVSKKTLQENNKDWNPAHILDLAIKASAGKNAEILQGKHSESFVIFNFIKDVTIDRFAFDSKTGAQAFIVDMWYIDKISHAMASVHKNQIEMFNKLKHAMVAFQIATCLALCDGSQRPVILTN